MSSRAADRKSWGPGEGKVGVDLVAGSELGMNGQQQSGSGEDDGMVIYVLDWLGHQILGCPEFGRTSGCFYKALSG